MTTGVVTSVSPHNGSGTLTADVAIGATVLPLDDAEPFAEDFTEPRYLVIGAETVPREYVATVNDESGQESVTLAVPLDVDVELGMPVTPWDPTVVSDDKRGVTHAVWVRLDGQDGTIRAAVPHELIPLSGVDTLIGASVGLTEDPVDGWGVESIYGRTAVIDQAAIDIASVSAYLDGPQTLSSGTWTTIGGWVLTSTHPSIDLPVSGGGNFFMLHVPGVYLAIATVRFDPSSSTGSRGAKISVGAAVTVAEVSYGTSAGGAAQIQVMATVVVAAPTLVSVQARQSSGGLLDVVVDDPVDTQVSIVRVA